MKREKGMLLLAAALLSFSACKAGGAAETTVVSETEAVTETTALPTEETVPETTEAELLHFDFPAEEVAVRAFLDDKERIELTDGSRDSRRMIEGESTLTVKSDSPFSALYLEWDAVPSPYRLSWEGGELTCGARGFQHDYVRLPQAVNAVTFSFFDHLKPVLCEIRAFTEGAAPEGVQDWQAPCEHADVLVFPTHSDDDALFFGALMSYYAVEMNLNVQTAFMTRHYSEPVRCHERLDGLWEMGIRHYPILSNAPDLYSETLEAAKYLYAGYDILGWQIQQIRRFRPQVVVGHDLNGEYGHGGHMLNAHSLIQAVQLAADENTDPDSAEAYGLWDTPKLYFHLYPENQISVDVSTPLERDSRGRTPFEIACDAYSHHKSQHWCYFAVSTDSPKENCVYFGLYRSLVGPDTQGDLMDNIGYG